MDPQTERLFRLTVTRFMVERELLRATLAMTPRCPQLLAILRRMPPVAPCMAMTLMARQMAISGEKKHLHGR